MSTDTLTQKIETHITIEKSHDNSTLLDLIDLAGHQNTFPRACKEGYCGACRCKLVKGTVEYIDEPLAFIGDGEILACYTKPTSDKVIIKNN